MKKLSVVFATVLLAGCAGGPSPLQLGAPVIKEVPITSGASRSFTVAKQTPSGKPVTADAILAAIADPIRAQFRGKTTVDSSKDSIDVVVFSWSYSLNYTESTVHFRPTIVAEGNNWEVTLPCPSTLESEIRDLSITGIPKVDAAKVGVQVAAACASVALNLPFVDEMRGEVDSKFNDVSVFSNYRRKLATAGDAWKNYQKDNKATALDIAKSEQFLIPSTLGDQLVSVVVYPYRNGAKVQYAFAYRYMMKGDGSTTYHAKTIDDAKQTLASIAND